MQWIRKISDYIKHNIIPISLLIFSLFNIYLLSPVLQEGFLYGDDSTSNYAYTIRVAEMIAAGNFRFWLPDFSMGQPLFFYYQPLPHLLTALLYLIFPFAEPLLIYKLLVLSGFVLIPLSMYQGMRWMDFSKSMCWIGAIGVLGINSWRGFGFEYQTLFWWGQYSHLWGLVIGLDTTCDWICLQKLFWASKIIFACDLIRPFISYAWYHGYHCLFVYCYFIFYLQMDSETKT